MGIYKEFIDLLDPHFLFKCRAVTSRVTQTLNVSRCCVARFHETVTGCKRYCFPRTVNNIIEVKNICFVMKCCRLIEKKCNASSTRTCTVRMGVATGKQSKLNSFLQDKIGFTLFRVKNLTRFSGAEAK